MTGIFLKMNNSALLKTKLLNLFTYMNIKY